MSARRTNSLPPVYDHWLGLYREEPSRQTFWRIELGCEVNQGGCRALDADPDGWEGCLADAGLDRFVVPHVLRHTAATWMMQAGVDPWEAAGMPGVTIETLHNTYGHHHPDFQDGAAGAFGGKASSAHD